MGIPFSSLAKRVFLDQIAVDPIEYSVKKQIENRGLRAIKSASRAKNSLAKKPSTIAGASC